MVMAAVWKEPANHHPLCGHVIWCNMMFVPVISIVMVTRSCGCGPGLIPAGSLVLFVDNATIWSDKSMIFRLFGRCFSNWMRNIGHSGGSFGWSVHWWSKHFMYRFNLNLKNLIWLQCDSNSCWHIHDELEEMLDVNTCDLWPGSVWSSPCHPT